MTIFSHFHRNFRDHTLKKGGKNIWRGEKCVLENMITKLHFALCLMFISYLERKLRNVVEISKNRWYSEEQSGFDPDVSILGNITQLEPGNCQIWPKSWKMLLFGTREEILNRYLRPPFSTVIRNRGCRFCSRRHTDLIQSALDRGVSGASQKTFPDKFGPFLTSPGSFEVARLVKKRRNFDLNLSFIHVTFWPNWKNVFLLR